MNQQEIRFRQPEEFQTAAKRFDLHEWVIHSCSICGRFIGFRFEDDYVFFDSNCGCTTYRSPLRRTNWAEVADAYNNFGWESPEHKARTDAYWRFDALYRLEAVQYGLDVIRAERERQVLQLDWSAEHDDQYVNNELVIYAAYWASSPEESAQREQLKKTLQSIGTTGWEDNWFKYEERTPEQRIARAGALLAAEIDRLKRHLDRLNGRLGALKPQAS